MACLEPVERILEEDRPKRHKATLTSHNQHRFALRTKSPKPISTNTRTTKSSSSLFAMTTPSLESTYPHIKLGSDDALMFKVYTLCQLWEVMNFSTAPLQTPVFRRVIDDMAAAIFTAPESSYVPDSYMIAQMQQGNVEAHKAYVQLC